MQRASPCSGETQLLHRPPLLADTSALWLCSSKLTRTAVPRGKKAVNNTRVPLSVTDLVAGKTMEPNPLYTGYGWTDVSGY
jgi:hypothetical protein